MQATSKLQIRQQFFPFLNITQYLNNIPLFRELTVTNRDETDALDITVKIHANIPCIEPFSWHADSIPASRELIVPLDQLKVNRSFLARLSETEKAIIYTELWQGAEKLKTAEATVYVYALEQFGGFQILPELIAAYITPNHPYVYHIKRKAAAILQQQGLAPMFEGYQSSDPERVLQMISAIYSALKNEEIIYSAIPPGYEETGQRLRLLNTIQNEKFGNCIDLSLLFAACLEAANLNPLLVIVKGHAFVACWLHDDKFSEIINDDKTAITKRLAKGIRELAAIEATTICKGTATSFGEALNTAEASLVQKEDFLLSVDIRRARTARIRPLPLLHNTSIPSLDEAAMQQAETADMQKDFELGTIYQDELLNGKAALTKQKIWERKLLDLSLRNNLLNLRFTRNMLQLVDINISHLEDILTDGKSFSIMPDNNAPVLYKYNLFLQPLHSSSALYQSANEELQYNRLLSYYHQNDLDNILSHIHKNAKQAVEENGSSTLFLAAGLLRWYDRKTPEQPRYAPILLLPVELNRRSVNSKFTLKSREEETMVNITLLEFLRQEYQLDLSGLEQLPYDEKGVDVARVMGILRRAIMQLKGWDVEEQLVLGNFSFSKLILWKDIVEQQEALLKSDIVRSLVEGKLVAENIQQSAEHTDFDNISSASLVLPIATDASQMEAVLTAQSGQSYILHGPPGTGKSQTITNIIADALFNGKKVLFVAAKKAALDVVHKRLEKIGLAPFSLELHSNKSRKSDVLEQLARSLETAKLVAPGNFEQEAQRLDAARNFISSYVNLLHQKQAWSWSLYNSITALEHYREFDFNGPSVPHDVLQQLDATRWQQWQDWLPAFQSIANVILHPRENPLAVLQVNTYSNSLQENIAELINQLLNILPAYQQNGIALAEAIQFPVALRSKTEWEQFALLVATLKAAPDMPFTLVQYLADKENHTAYEEWSQHFAQYQKSLALITEQYNRNILAQDVANIEMQWKRAEQCWFLPKWLQKRKIRKQLLLYKNQPPLSDNGILQLFQLHTTFKEEQNILNQPRYQDVQKALKNLYREEHTDLAAIALKATIVQRLSAMMVVFGRQALPQWITTLQQQQLQYTDDLKNIEPGLWQTVQQSSTAVNNGLQQFRELAGFSTPVTDGWIDATLLQLQKLQAHLPHLKSWINYVQQANAGKSLQLHWLISAFENGHCSARDLESYFLYTTHLSTAQKIIEQHEPLSLFNTAMFESRIEQYKKIAEQFQQLTIQTLRMKLAAQLPHSGIEAMQSSEPGILQRAIRNRGRGMSIRRLFDQLPSLLPRLAPCMLMSPISVAQYFDADINHFDLVIFDEASQLPTCEAVSALGRARQAVIVGDPKQMPPTSFFTTHHTDEENIEVEDLESILDDCLSLSIPSKYLLRHYRSKHESLIAFSNASYYENKLLTFPSSDDLNRKVLYHPVSGYYDKGKTRTNRFEADAIVQFIQQHYADAEKKHLSIGVVTFSQTQQSLVEDTLQQVFMQQPMLEQLANQHTEPLFIKNLENVQGDERDVILFSVGYAPDENGKMTMNFGPLNRNGGWRRLNVAVTRARHEMHVFACLKADQVDLSRTSAEGVAGLKAFLQFAEKGQLALRAQDISSDTDQLSYAISKRLQQKGLTIQCNIGTSGFKIDLGIVHPHKPQQYILGILIDGDYYYNARTSNDRERVMPSVLQGLGWNLHKLWSMDWFENSEAIIEAIVNKVNDLVLQPAKTQQVASPVISAPAAEPIATMQPSVLPRNNLKQRPYLAHALSKVPGGSSEALYDVQQRDRIKQQILMLVNMEAPISKNLLYKKLLQAWNTSRAGARMDAHLQEIIREMNLAQTEHHQPFYWSNGITSINHYRDNDSEKRGIEDIAPEEIAVALQEVIDHNLSIEEDELLRYLCRCFGFTKVGKQMETLLRYVIDQQEQQGLLKREGGRVKLP